MKHINKKFLPASKKPLLVAATVLIFFIIGGVYAVVAYNSASAKLERAYSLAPEIKNIYKLDKLSLILPAQDENSVEMKLGERDANEFIPNLEISRWEGEVKMKIKPQVSEPLIVDKALSFDQEKIKVTTSQADYRYYDIPPNQDHPRGAYEFEVILKVKPESNVVTLDIETENLDFFSQPDGSYSAYPHNSPYHDGKIHQVIGAFSILRPKIIDNAGAWVWGELNIDTAQGKLTIVVPQDFLNKGVYPIVVDPTIAVVSGATASASSETPEGTTLTATFAQNVAAGDLLIAAVSWQGLADIYSVIDGKSQTWIVATSTYDSGNDQHWAIYYFYNTQALTTAAEKIVTLTTSNVNYRFLVITEFSGALATADPLDKTAVGNMSFTAATDGVYTSTSPTPSQDNELFFCTMMMVSSNHLPLTAGTDFGLITNGIAPNNSDWVYHLQTEYFVQTTAAGHLGTFTNVDTDTYGISLATFKAEAAGTSCGDGTCNGDETCATCPADCGACKAIFKPGVILKRNVIFGRPAGGGAAWACGDSVNFTYNGSSVTYGTVASASSTCWLDRNLGASQAANATTDSAAYGDLFQWGREDDGHQVRSPAPGTVEGDMTLTAQPGHANFIIEQDLLYDWATTTWITRWTVAASDPCPSGWHVPTITEWNTERLSWGFNNSEGAFASPLKLTLAGDRYFTNAMLGSEGSYGNYWGNTVTADYGDALFIELANAYDDNNYRAYGYSVRCLKD